MRIIRPPVTIGPATWDWSKTYIFGVVNVTPDSFSDGGRFFATDEAIKQALELVAAGADAIDVGGESTRPGAGLVSADEEKQRVLPVIEALVRQANVPISIDTYKAEVAEAAVAAGASVINDISGMRLDPQMPETVARSGATVVCGHLRGEPATMMQRVSFDDVVVEVIEELRECVRVAIRAGVAVDRIWVDPGIGFGKRTEQSVALLAATERLVAKLGYPLMVGVSRKSFIGEITGLPVDQRLEGSCAASAIVIAGGADAVRLHDVAALVPAMKVADAIRVAQGDRRAPIEEQVS